MTVNLVKSQEEIVGLEGKDSSTKYLQRNIYMYYRDKKQTYNLCPNKIKVNT